MSASEGIPRSIRCTVAATCAPLQGVAIDYMRLCSQKLIAEPVGSSMEDDNIPLTESEGMTKNV